MTKIEKASTFSRRALLQAGGTDQQLIAAILAGGTEFFDRVD